MPLANIIPESAGEGLFEHTIESFQMVFGSWKPVSIVMAYSLSVTGLNLTGTIVTVLSTAVHRNIYEALRSIAGGVLSVVHYAFPDSGAGEHFNYSSFLEAFGFIISVFGSFLSADGCSDVPESREIPRGPRRACGHHFWNHKPLGSTT
jgi:hypothetical protein